MDQQRWALNALDRSVRAMRRSSSASELCQSCCDAITIDEAYPLAWIGFALNDEEHNIEIVAKSGQDTAYLAEARITWADEPNGRGLAGSAIRSGKTQVVGNVDSSPVLEPWRKVVSRAGFHSAIGIPIFDGPECFGVLMVYSGQLSAFDDDAVSVLENLAEVIGFGVSLYRTTQTLRKNEQNFRSLIEAIPDAIFLKDGDSRWEITNEPAKRLFHLHSIPWEGKTEMELADLHPEFRTAHENCLADDEKAWHARELTLFSEIVPNDEGAMRDFEVRKVPVFNEDNQRQALMIIGRDITERKQAEAKLLLSASVFSHASEAILITAADGSILDVNHAFTNITGYNRDEVIGKNPSILSSGHHGKEFYATMWRDLTEQGFHFGEIWNKRKNGEVYPEMQTISAVRDDQGKVVHYVALFSDITKHKQAEEKIHHLAFYDPLTQLPNRRLLMDRLHSALSNSMRSHHYGAVLFLDMDRFKTLNDTLGHEQGDRLLIEVARRILSCVREVDTVARLGGDEFVVLLEEVDEHAEAASQKTAHIAEKIRTSLAKTYQLNGHDYISSSSIGVTLFRGNNESPDALLKYADIAMYQVKESGRNAVRFFDPDMQLTVETRAALESDLRHAEPLQQLQLYYQIQMGNDHLPIGAEALVRWVHPTRGTVLPGQFISVAEESSLIIDIGGWVLDTACKQLSAWSRNEHTSNLILAVNVSAHQFRQPDFVEKVAFVLHAYGVDASRLKLELTESVVLNDVADVVSKMHALKSLRVKLAMDDFGTGYSSLSYLKQLPLDQIKIDQSFVRYMTSDQNDAMMVRAIIDMAKNFRLNVIAEGVETEAQLSLLKHLGCTAYQGYFFSKPVPIEQFEELLKQG